MGRLLLFLLIALTGMSILVLPWMSGIAYILNSLWQPQYIWFWVFQGVPIYKITAGMAIIALFSAVAQKKVDFKCYQNKQNFIVVLLWGWVHLSDAFSSFPDAVVSVSPDIVLGALDSIFIMYFVLLPLFDNGRGINFLCYAFLFVGGYYVYWSNSAYFSQEWFKFVNGRLVGPSGSPYEDGNVLSVLLVMCMPFIILFYFKLKYRMSRLVVLLYIPLSWHALVLLSSRAALLSAAVVLVAIAYVIRSKRANFVIVVSFMLFIAYQGALVMQRATDTIEIAEAYPEQPINPRLVSWEAGLRLIPKYPFLGAGVQKFEAATKAHFPGMTPHVAHNTFLNFSANTGLVAGFSFIALVYICIARLKLTRKWHYSLHDDDWYALLASSISMLGFFVCSLFLDLIIFEPFYVVLMLNLLSYRRVVNANS